jgi:hypothetical protein
MKIFKIRRVTMKKNLYKKITISLAILITSLLWFNCANVSAVPIPGLFNTGVDDSGVALGISSDLNPVQDPHYIMTSNLGTPAVTISSTLLHPTYGNLGPGNIWWTAAPTGSNWIGPMGGNTWYPNYGDLVGFYSFDLTFDMTGLDPSTAWITGNVAHDNYLSVFFNGVNLGISNPTQFTDLTRGGFAIDDGFLSGLNHLIFQVENVNVGQGTSPIGLLVTLQGEATPVPEPSTLLFLGMGLLGLAGMGRKWIQKK